MARTGLYPGTFDPVTLGHVDIIKRAAKLVDRLYIGIAINRDKGPLFDLDERVAMIERVAKPIAEFQSIASRLVKEIARLGGDVSHFVPEEVAAALSDKYNR